MASPFISTASVLCVRVHSQGKIKREIADQLALDEYKKYRIVQDKNYISDFDELITKTKNF